jgi:hypothetical protein
MKLSGQLYILLLPGLELRFSVMPCHCQLRCPSSNSRKKPYCYAARILPSSGLLRGVRWFETDVLGLPILHIFKDQALFRQFFDLQKSSHCTDLGFVPTALDSSSLFILIFLCIPFSSYTASWLVSGCLSATEGLAFLFRLGNESRH